MAASALCLDGPIRTAAGLISGTTGEVTSFKGIPYAAPPVGDLRWKPPQPPPKWEGVRAFTDFGAVCCGNRRDLHAGLYGMALLPNQSRRTA